MTSNIKHTMESMIPVVFSITTKAYTGVFMTLMMTIIGGNPLSSVKRTCAEKLIAGHVASNQYSVYSILTSFPWQILPLISSISLKK